MRVCASAVRPVCWYSAFQRRGDSECFTTTVERQQHQQPIAENKWINSSWSFIYLQLRFIHSVLSLGATTQFVISVAHVLGHAFIIFFPSFFAASSFVLITSSKWLLPPLLPQPFVIHDMKSLMEGEQFINCKQLPNQGNQPQTSLTVGYGGQKDKMLFVLCVNRVLVLLSFLFFI